MKAHRLTPMEEPTRRSMPSGRGGLYAFMAGEHAHLDELLDKGASEAKAIDTEAYERFRERLLRHIRIEERILLPMAQRKRGQALPVAARLRLDHGALAALLMLPPTVRTFGAVRVALDEHNALEEVEGGVYDQCESLAGSEIDELLAQIAATPRVRASRWVDSPNVVTAAQRALMRAGYDPGLLEPSVGASRWRSTARIYRPV